MRNVIYIIIGVFSLMCQTVLGASSVRVHYLPEDSVLICRLLAQAPRQGDSCLPLYFARQLTGHPYVAHTLELFPDDEQLIVNTRQLDCTTLVETVTALTLCTQQHQTSFAEYCAALQSLRYRQGVCAEYPSRLHYFSDWIEDNTRMGLVAEVQRKESPFDAVQRLSLNYMSTHPAAYASLKNSPSYVREITVQERRLSGKQYRYIPKSQVKNTDALRQAVHDGDIIAITTNKAGLDIAHLGFALWQDDGLHLLNASMIHKKVVIEPMTLGQYLAKHSSHTGIRVVRIQKNNQYKTNIIK